MAAIISVQAPTNPTIDRPMVGPMPIPEPVTSQITATQAVAPTRATTTMSRGRRLPARITPMACSGTPVEGRRKRRTALVLEGHPEGCDSGGFRLGDRQGRVGGMEDVFKFGRTGQA